MFHIERGTIAIILFIAALIAGIAVGLAIEHPILKSLPHPLIPWGLMLALAISIPFMFFSDSNTRAARLRQKAQELNLSFMPRDRRFYTTLRNFSSIRCYSRREDRLYNIISGDWQGRELSYFDYTHHSQGDGDIDGSHYQHSGLVIASAQSDFPPFSVLSKDGLRKDIEAWSLVQKFIGKPGSDFDRLYTIKSKKRDRIREKLPDELLLHFESHPERCLEVQEDRLLYYAKDGRIELDDFDGFLQEGTYITTLLEQQFQT